MANYFTYFSFQFVLPDKAAQAYALDLISQANRVQQGDEPPADYPELLKGVEGWCFEVEPSEVDGKHALWLHSLEGGVDAVCVFVQHLLHRFDPKGRVGFEWSYDCSKPRPNAYGGGAAFITATEIKSLNTHQWLQQQLV